jgi:hypothetical protein
MAASKIATAPGPALLGVVIPANAGIRVAGFPRSRVHIVNPVATERFEEASCFIELELRV